MRSNLAELIAAHEPSFSKGQRRIAQFIRTRYDEAAFMTAGRLGQEVGVSESTVVRFATQLGFEGYPCLQKALQELIRSKLTIVQRMEVARAQMPDDRVLQDVATGDIQNIRRTLEQLNPADFDRAVDAVVNARQIYVFGAGSCKALAGFLFHYLQMLLGGRAHQLTASSQSDIYGELLDIGSEDTLLVITFPRYSSKAAKTLQYARSKGARVVAMTDSRLSPIASGADALLLAHSGMASVVDSLVAPLSVINALIVAVSLRTLEQNRQKLEELERLWDDCQVYEHVEETEKS